MNPNAMNSAEILARQVASVKDPAEAIPVLSEMFLRLAQKIDQDGEINRKEHALILRTLNGDPEDVSYADKAIHSRLRVLEDGLMQTKAKAEIHERLLRGDPSNAEECGLVDNIQNAMRMVRGTQRVMWIALGVIIPAVVVLLLKLLP